MENVERTTLQRKMVKAMDMTLFEKGKGLDISLSLFLASFGDKSQDIAAPASRYDVLDAAHLLSCADNLSKSDPVRVVSFTMDELLDVAFPGKTLLAEHDVKVWAGRLLIAAGYERRQVRRRGGARPLVWERGLITNR